MHVLNAAIMTFFLCISCGTVNRTQSTDSSLQAGARIANTGMALVKPSYFVPNCVYGPDQSLSDHAPVIYVQQKIATWNIAQKASAKLKASPSSGPEFRNHKFRDYDNGSPVHESNADYRERLKNIATAIEKLLNDNKLEQIVVQEIPIKDKFSTHFKAELSSRGLHLFTANSDSAAIIKADIFTDVKVGPEDPEARLFPVCRRKDKSCFVSAHVVYAANDLELKDRCQSIIATKNVLQQRGFTQINIVGDFNASAAKFLRACSGLEDFNPVINTYAGPGQSCSDNKGTHSPNNIDLLMQWSIKN